MEEEKKKINFKYNLKVYWGIIKKYKLLLSIIFFFLLITDCVNVGINFLFKSFVDKSTQFSTGALGKVEFTKFLIITGTIFLGSMMLRAIASWIYNGSINKLETGAIYDLKKKYFDHLIGLSHNFYTTHKTGSIISRLSRGASSMERITDILVYNMTPLIFQLVIVLTSFAYFDSAPAIIVSAIVVIFITWSMILQKLQESTNLAANKAEDIEKGNVSDMFTNVESIKYFGKEEYIKKKFSGFANKTRELLLKNWNYYKIRGTGQMVILATGSFSLMYYSAMAVLNGHITIGTLVFIYTTYLSLLGPLNEFVWGLRGFYRSMADFNDLFEYGMIENEIKDATNSKNLKIKSGKINFDEVTFYYDKRKIFDNFSLKINPGERVAIVGHSGSGKSTLIKLLYRFYEVKSGEIKIDDKDIRTVKQNSLRSEMAIVPQECVLFDDTIYNNIAFSKPNASKKEVMKAIKFAQLDKLVNRLPNKENTIVGERGIKLSGGEKQRVSIARAILGNKKILILDEATSSLDSQTEHEIQLSLKKLMENRTSIIIAHRLSTIMNADKIVVMKRGKIVQIGKHEELIKVKGEYQDLWNMQRGGYVK